MANTYYPPVNFYFKVVFDDFSGNKVDVSFQSVGGLDVQFDTENFKEGGENRFEHVMPSRTKYPDLVLKRGVIRPGTGKSDITDWIKKAVEEFNIEPRNLHIYLLNQKGDPLFSWYVIHAWPKSWKMTELNAEKGEVFIETIELNYNRFIFSLGNKS